MPSKNGYKKSTISENMKTEMKSGKQQKPAILIALSVGKKEKPKKGKK